ncbi:MAG: glycosyltransferase [Ramlibacter sp.]|nr:glycosyltransferase [Ramlibacter sp.]
MSNPNCLKVLHVIPSVSVLSGGPSKAIAMMEKALASLGVSVTTVTTDDDGPYKRRSSLGSTKSEPVHVSRIYFRKWIEYYKVAPTMVPWLWRHAREFDVIHIHALFSFSSVAAALIARLRGVPYVIRPLGTLTTYGITVRRRRLKRASLACLEGPALREAAAVHFTSNQEKFEAEALGIPMRDVVIPLGIEPAKSSVDGLVFRHYPKLNACKYVLYLSRLDPKKNVETLLHSFASIRATWPNVKLLLAGDGASSYVDSLKSLACDLDIQDSVVWTGHIAGPVKASAFANAELFVLPSFSENFGIAAAEALMAGIPCILASGVAIAKETAEAGAGLCVAPIVASISGALEQLLGDQRMRAEMSVRAVAFAQARYSAETMGRELTQLYTRLSKR